MRAIQYDRFGGPEVLQLVDLPAPSAGPGEVAIDVRAASVIPGDWKLRAGHLQHLFPIRFPKIPGRDGAGVVAEVGAGVEGLWAGDAVCFVTQHTESGSYAQRVIRSPAALVRKPANLSFAEGAALMHAGVCAWIALMETARIKAGTRVLIHGGAGAIGGAAVQIAHHAGAWVAATCRAVNMEYVRGLGADRVIAYDRQDFAETLSDIDVVFDLVGGTVHARSHRVVVPGGMVVWLIAQPFEPVAGSTARSVQARIHDDRSVLERVVGLANAGALRPQVSAVLSLVDAAEAHRRLERGANSRGRIVLSMA